MRKAPTVDGSLFELDRKYNLSAAKLGSHVYAIASWIKGNVIDDSLDDELFSSMLIVVLIWTRPKTK